MGRPGLPTSLLRASGAALGVPGAVVVAAWATGSLGALGLYAPTTAYEPAAASELPSAAGSTAGSAADVPGARGPGAPTTVDTAAVGPASADAPTPRRVGRQPAAAAAHAVDHHEPAVGRRAATARSATRPIAPPVHAVPVPARPLPADRAAPSPVRSATREATPSPAPVVPSVRPSARPSAATTTDDVEQSGSDTTGGLELPLGHVSVLSFG